MIPPNAQMVPHLSPGGWDTKKHPFVIRPMKGQVWLDPGDDEEDAKTAQIRERLPLDQMEREWCSGRDIVAKWSTDGRAFFWEYKNGCLHHGLRFVSGPTGFDRPGDFTKREGWEREGDRPPRYRNRVLYLVVVFAPMVATWGIGRIGPNTSGICFGPFALLEAMVRAEAAERAARGAR